MGRPKRGIRPEWYAWQKQLKRVQKTLDNLDDTPAIHGVKWTDKMIDYWQKQIIRLKSIEPVKNK